MEQIINDINTIEYKGLQVSKLTAPDNIEVLHICLEKDTAFKKHISPKDTQLIVLEGCITFHINHKEFVLNKHQVFNFEKQVEHWVEAHENSKFLIIR